MRGIIILRLNLHILQPYTLYPLARRVEWWVGEEKVTGGREEGVAKRGGRGGEERRKGWRGKGALQANFCLLFIFYKANLVPHQYSSGFKSKFLC